VLRLKNRILLLLKRIMLHSPRQFLSHKSGSILRRVPGNDPRILNAIDLTVTNLIWIP
jgi:hypothetical protein